MKRQERIRELEFIRHAYSEFTDSIDSQWQEIKQIRFSINVSHSLAN